MPPRNRLTNLVPSAEASAPRVARTKFAIVGFTDHRKFAPFADPEWEIWGLNDLYYELSSDLPADRLRWFQLHSWHQPQPHKPEASVLDKPIDFSGGPPHARDPNHVPWLAEQAKRLPVYLLNPRAEVPDARIFPMDEAFRFFSLDGETPNKYFTNSISYMIALAIMELCPNGLGAGAVDGAEIGVWGVDMMMGGGEGSEYGFQRPSCEFFLGIARGAGITVRLPRESDLLHTAFPYGDLHGSAFRTNVEFELNGMRERRANLQQQIQHCSAGVSELTGAISMLERMLANHMPGDGTDPSEGRVPRPNAHRGLRPVAPQAPDVNPPKAQELTINSNQLAQAVADVLPRVLPHFLEPVPATAAASDHRG